MTDDQYIQDFIATCSFEVAPKHREEEWKEKWKQEWDFGIDDEEKIEDIKKQVKATTFKVAENRASDVAKMLAERSSANLSKNDKYSISESAQECLRKADIILFSGRKLETNVGGALIVPGVGEAVRTSPALKIYLPNFLNLSADKQIIDQLDRMSRYLSGKLRYKEQGTGQNRSLLEDDGHYFDYILAEFSAWDQILLNDLTRIVEETSEETATSGLMWTNNGNTSFLGVDSSQIHDSGFYASVLLVETLFSLYEIKNAGIEDPEGNPPPEEKKGKRETKFKIANYGRLMQASFIGNRQDWKKAPLGLFRNQEGEYPQKIKDLIDKLKNDEELDEIKEKGAFVFDVDMTILPSGSKAKLDSYQYLAYLFMLLLRRGIRVAIISGNSEQRQMERIYQAIRTEMKDDPSGSRHKFLTVSTVSSSVILRWSSVR